MKTLLKTDRILIIGGTGFIGQHLARKCLEYTSSVTCLGFSGKSSSDNFIQVDITYKDKLGKSLVGRKFDYVFNLGGYVDHTAYLRGGRKVVDSHFTALMNIIDSIEHSTLKGFVQVGSSDEYGGVPGPQKESVREEPISPYSFSKMCSSHFVQMLSVIEKFPGVVLRFFLVYGPGQDEERFLPQIIRGCLNNEEFKTSEGKQLRDFCYVGDVVDAMIKAAVYQEAKGHIINVASGIPIKIKDMIKTVVNLTGGGKPLWGVHPYRPGENMRLYADTTLAKKLLKWEAKTSLEDGLRKTIDYYKIAEKHSNL
ncbi:MAG: NAD-dependent epimerase/dehydratase family protein [Elusimicrobia bacterium]|nr:NAD-dependent epimerase/dehydratase family protein [Elusimicrobiota bacterium]